MIEVANLVHRYGAVEVLRLESLRLEAGESCLLLGPSGCGKSTLLHILAGLLRPAEGRVVVAGADLAALQGAALDRHRGTHIGIVPQKLHLVSSLTLFQNLALAQSMAGLAVDAHRIGEVLESVGLADRARSRPRMLSQGQAQRAAVARAVVNRPKVLLADEPTSSLDDGNAAAALDLLESQARANEATLVVATHDARAAARIRRQVRLPVDAGASA